MPILNKEDLLWYRLYGFYPEKLFIHFYKYRRAEPTIIRMHYKTEIFEKHNKICLTGGTISKNRVLLCKNDIRISKTISGILTDLLINPKHVDIFFPKPDGLSEDFHMEYEKDQPAENNNIYWPYIDNSFENIEMFDNFLFRRIENEIIRHLNYVIDRRR